MESTHNALKKYGFIIKIPIQNLWIYISSSLEAEENNVDLRKLKLNVLFHKRRWACGTCSLQLIKQKQCRNSTIFYWRQLGAGERGHVINFSMFKNKDHPYMFELYALVLPFPLKKNRIERRGGGHKPTWSFRKLRIWKDKIVSVKIIVFCQETFRDL